MSGKDTKREFDSNFLESATIISANQLNAGVMEKATDEVPEMDEAAIAAHTAGMSELEKRLFRVRLKLNQGRKANKKEVENEFKRFSDPKYEQRERSGDWTDKKKRWDSELKTFGLTKGESYKLDTAEKAGKLQDKAEQKDRNRATFGWEAFTSEAYHRSYEKQLGKLQSSSGVKLEASSSRLMDNPLEYGKVGADVSREGLNRLTKSIEDKEKSKAEYSRRRTSYDAANVDYINDPNAHFNKKIKRAFDKYTVEIRQNLERGTAL
eukprot:gene39022-51330_t